MLRTVCIQIALANAAVSLAAQDVNTNWMADSTIRVIRGEYNEVEARIGGGEWEGYAFEEVCGAPSRPVRVLEHRDDHRSIRRVVLSTDFADGSAEARYYFDDDGHLRFMFANWSDLGGIEWEARHYYSNNSRIHSDVRRIGDSTTAGPFASEIESPYQLVRSVCSDGLRDTHVSAVVPLRTNFGSNFGELVAGSDFEMEHRFAKGRPHAGVFAGFYATLFVNPSGPSDLVRFRVNEGPEDGIWQPQDTLLIESRGGEPTIKAYGHDDSRVLAVRFTAAGSPYTFVKLEDLAMTRMDVPRVAPLEPTLPAGTELAIYVSDVGYELHFASDLMWIRADGTVDLLCRAVPEARVVIRQSAGRWEITGARIIATQRRNVPGPAACQTA